MRLFVYTYVVKQDQLWYNGIMKNITTSTYSFENVIRGGYTYVDKTAILHQLASKESGQFFMSRPRRFGKSLMISTLKNLFQGRRDLFKGLAVDSLDWGWEAYPIIHFDMSAIKSRTMADFKMRLNHHVNTALAEAGFVANPNLLADINFSDAIKALSVKAGKKVVILIDEYDAPVGHVLDDVKLASDIRDALSEVYGQIKTNEGSVRFLMMTGVSKFTQLSVLSALNNLDDVTFWSEYAALFGYTEEELETYFAEHMHKHADVMGRSYEDYRADLKFWCNGYRFATDNPVRVYNPVAIGKTLSQRLPYFGKCWEATDRASSLMNHLKKNELAELNYECLAGVKESVFDVCGLEDISTIGLLYQSGYLTIEDYDPDRRNYTLGVPNQEIREDLTNLIVYSQKGEREGTSIVNDISNGLFDEKFDLVEEALKAYYVGLTYGSREKVAEPAYQRILHTLLAAGGFDVTSEEQQAVGRADLVAKHKLGIFVFELKLDESADAALAQIEEKHYCDPYLNATAPVFAVGINFNSQTRNVDGFKVVCRKVKS